MFAFHFSGKLIIRDYEQFIPEFDRLLLLHGKLRVLVDMTSLYGWSAGALWAEWADTKFGIHHFHNIDRLAVVSEKKCDLPSNTGVIRSVHFSFQTFHFD